MTKDYVESGSLSVLNIYIREAHPTDGWVAQSNEEQGICIAQTRTLEERLRAANSFVEMAHDEQCLNLLEEEMGPVLVDDPSTNALDRAYEAPPERLVLVDATTMEILFATGQGPFQYDTRAAAAFLDKHATEYRIQGMGSALRNLQEMHPAAAL